MIGLDKRFDAVDKRFGELQEQRKEDRAAMDRQFDEVKAEIRELRSLVQEVLKSPRSPIVALMIPPLPSPMPSARQLLLAAVASLASYL